MSPKYHPTPLSGGDRKALKKELAKSAGMTTMLARQSEVLRAKGEDLIRQADRLSCESWNERMWSVGAPIDPSPTVDQAINGGFPWLQIECSRCRTPRDIDLAALKTPPTTCVHDLATRLRCEKCKKAGKRPRAHERRSVADICFFPTWIVPLEMKRNPMLAPAVRPPEYTFDKERLAALDQFQILDTPPEKGFDDIVELATGFCATPVALVSLVAGDRQWFKARIGFDPCETDLSRSVCAHALVEPDILEIEDLTQDPRSSSNPLVVESPHIRFYAGAPMRTAGGQVIGSLCVIDTKPRPGGLTPPQRNALRALARQVITQLELRSAVAERDVLLISQKGAEERRHGLLHLGDGLRDATTIAEMTRSAAMIAGKTVGANRAAFARFDATGEHLTVEPDWTAEGVASIAGTHRMADYGRDLQAGLLQGDLLVINDVTSDPRTADHQSLQRLDIRSLVNVPIRENGRTVAALIVHAAEPRTWPEEELTFLRNVADRVEVGVARLEAENQQRLLNGELSHRMKNTMALVQAIASQTLRSIPDQAPVKSFSERVLAMSIAHDILLQESWEAAQIGPLIDAVACTFSDPARFDIEGPSVTLGSRATLALSLLVHELTTNALKYGALSNDVGRVQVSWDLQADGSELRLIWRETGGPSVAPPSRKGFGSKLIRLGLIGTGGAELHYNPSGFEADFTAPLAELHS